VTAMLNVCAPTNAQTGRPPSIDTSDVSDVSRPIDTNAISNQAVRIAVSSPRVLATTGVESANEKRTEATMKPRTNFGNRSQTTAIVTCGRSAVGLRTAHQ